MKRLLASAFLFAALFTSAVAHADSQFSYSFSGAGVSGSGDTTIADTATAGVFMVTSISGQLNGTNITGLLPVDTYKNNDNLFYENDTFLDADGVSFALDNGTNVNIFYVNGDWFVQGDGDFVLDSGSTQPDSPMLVENFSFQAFAAPTPEPSSLALMGTGVLGVMGAVRRRLAKA